MTDFFGGILDSIRGSGDDISGFFDSAIGQAVAKGATGGFGSQEKKKPVDINDGMVGVSAGSFNPGDTRAKAKSSDWSSTEIEWLRRLQRFSGLSTGTEVKLGSIK